MLPTAIIVFREVLEAALIVSIVLAATRGAKGRGLWITIGVLVGVMISGVLAYFAESLAQALEGFGQELFNAGILSLAVLMLGWHNIWMQQHGRELAREMNAVGRAVSAGEKPLYVLAIVVGLAVMREGSELVLFLLGLARSESGGVTDLLLGGGLGLFLGVLVGLVLYWGLARIPVRYFFKATSLLILFLSAGLAAQAAHFLVEADWLPPLGESLWDTSWLLPEDGVVGQILHALIGYVARPDGVQLIVYGATIVLTLGLMRWVERKPPNPAP